MFTVPYVSGDDYYSFPSVERLAQVQQKIGTQHNAIHKAFCQTSQTRVCGAVAQGAFANGAIPPHPCLRSCYFNACFCCELVEVWVGGDSVWLDWRRWPSTRTRSTGSISHRGRVRELPGQAWRPRQGLARFEHYSTLARKIVLCFIVLAPQPLDPVHS